jgi:sterol desaturase/sphingolipid hydroxylase (fatty acid hydroxylase superfamily)
MPIIPSWSPAVAAAGALALLWIAEGLFPLVVDRGLGWRRRLVNMGAGLVGYGLAAVALSGLTLAATLWAQRAGFGLVNWTDWHWSVRWLVVLLVLDLWAYAWHVLCHLWRPLWRFHVVHHHDEHVDVTTAFRFHVVEIVAKGLLTIPVLLLVGATIQQLLLCETITVAVVAFHHGNIRLPGWLERPTRAWLVTPAVHVVHHSRWQPETNSNYGAIFSFWDRIFGTFRVRRDPSRIDFGIDGYDERDTSTFAGLMRTPFGPIKSRYGQTPEEFREPPDPARAEHATPPEVVVEASPARAGPRRDEAPAGATRD